MKVLVPLDLTLIKDNMAVLLPILETVITGDAIYERKFLDGTTDAVTRGKYRAMINTLKDRVILALNNPALRDTFILGDDIVTNIEPVGDISIFTLE